MTYKYYKSMILLVILFSLNDSAPEIQHKSLGSKSSDLYSLGMLMVALFNGGQSLIQANYSTNLYFKQAGMVSKI